MVNKGGAWGLEALNSKLLKTKLSALLTTKDPCKSKLALGPKITPLGLIRNRFALPNTPKVPRRLDTLVPVTLVNIFSIKAGLAK